MLTQMTIPIQCVQVYKMAQNYLCEYIHIILSFLLLKILSSFQ